MSTSTLFQKWEGLGNDFIVIDGLPPSNAPELAQKLCARHTGIGADGLLFLGPEPRMQLFNSDGSRAAMCGNALRCIGSRWHRDGKLALGESLEVQTDSGPRQLRLERADWVEVDMGAPSAVEGCPQVVALPEIGLPGHYVSMGNPHLVVLCPEGAPSEKDVRRWGAAWQSPPWAPEGGINVEFVSRSALPDKGDRLRVQVWERGAGLTQACGTGACAAIVSAVRVGWVQGPTWVDLTGGPLQIEWNGQGSVRMAGPAREVFRGDIQL